MGTKAVVDPGEVPSLFLDQKLTSPPPPLLSQGLDPAQLKSCNLVTCVQLSCTTAFIQLTP